METGGILMDQKPMPGVQPLEPPTPEMARRYLDEVEAVTARRDSQVDLRGQGWITIVEALVMLLFVACCAVLIRSGQASHVSLLLFAMLAASQILSGAAQSRGVQWRFRGSRTVYIVVIVFTVIAMLSSFVLFLVAPQLSLASVLLPAAVGTAALVGLGIRQLWAGRDAPHGVRRDRPPFLWPARGTTIGLGALLGALIIVAGTADLLVSNLLAILAGGAIIVMSIGNRADWGPVHLGEVWRWPQISMFTFGALSLTAVVTIGDRSDLVNPWSTTILGAIVVVLAVLVSLIGSPARGGRDG
jgi:hypothetical protein